MSAERPGEWIAVLDTDELEVGEMAGFEIGERQIAVYRVAGGFFATANICTHAFAVLTDGWLEGDTVECPLHGGCFNVCTGKALGNPVEVDLETFKTRVSGTRVEVYVPLDADAPSAAQE